MCLSLTNRRDRIVRQTGIDRYGFCDSSPGCFLTLRDMPLDTFHLIHFRGRYRSRSIHSGPFGGPFRVRGQADWRVASSSTRVEVQTASPYRAVFVSLWPKRTPPCIAFSAISDFVCCYNELVSAVADWWLTPVIVLASCHRLKRQNYNENLSSAIPSCPTVMHPSQRLPSHARGPLRWMLHTSRARPDMTTHDTRHTTPNMQPASSREWDFVPSQNHTEASYGP